MATFARGVIVLAIWLALAVPVTAQTPPHPLAGKIFATRTGVLTDLSNPAVVGALFPCGAITLLGEVHDNKEHHRMRGDLVRGLANDGELSATCRLRSFIFEHISADQDQKLNSFYETWPNPDDPEVTQRLFSMLEWDKSGWPSRHMFVPLMSEIIRHGGAIVAGNPKRDVTRMIAREGLGTLDPPLVAGLGLDRPVPDAHRDGLLHELEASHCGLVPKGAFGNMAAAQRYRDAHIAEAALKAAAAIPGAVVFAGNGHVRTDRGVPYYIKQRAPHRMVIAVTFTEVEDGNTDPALYGPRDATGRPATDYVAFAAPAAREDPCEAMRKMFGK